MRIMICDDRQKELEDLQDLCRRYIGEKNLDAQLICTTDGEEPLRDRPDILILDIEMPGKSGIEIKDRLAAFDRPLILFVTSYPDNMSEAFGRNVVAFLQKPVDLDDLSRKLNVALDILTGGRSITFEDGSVIHSSRICSFVSEGKYTAAVLTDGTRKQWLRRSLSTWEKELQGLYFVRADNSCLVNCEHVMRMHGDVLILDNGEKIKVSRRRKKDCSEKLKACGMKYAAFA